MSGLSRTLAVIGLLGILGAMALVCVEARTLEVEQVSQSAQILYQEAFGKAPWSWLALGTALGLVLAVVANGIEVATRLGRPAAAPSFDPLHPGSVREAVAEVGRRVERCLAGEAPHVISAFDEIVRGAVQVAASDIHISPTPDALCVTYRVHGTLYEVARIAPALAPMLATRVKVMARLDTYVRGVPQDGRLTMQVEQGAVEARVSTLPTEVGERVVLRLVRGSTRVPRLDGLGFSPEVASQLRQLLSKPQGLLFVTGPVGSGKTTTLYSLLEHISETRGRTTTLVSLEDPIEIELGFATQTQMHRKAGMTFASVLRSVLRQDPNVLMVGEVRDQETAEIAMQAGLTGHLILTTVHGEGATGPFARLIDMGIEPFVLASATLGSLSQRLVRTLCTACRRQVDPDPLHRERFARLGVEIAAGTYYEPVGCPFCEQQGFTGRTPIAELLVMDGPLRESVNARVPSADLYQQAVRIGMTPLIRDGLVRAEQGMTSLGEVLRVAG